MVGGNESSKLNGRLEKQVSSGVGRTVGACDGEHVWGVGSCMKACKASLCWKDLVLVWVKRCCGSLLLQWINVLSSFIVGKRQL